jgi:hypothetical protein
VPTEGQARLYKRLSSVTSSTRMRALSFATTTSKVRPCTAFWSKDEGTGHRGERHARQHRCELDSDGPIAAFIRNVLIVNNVVDNTR